MDNTPSLEIIGFDLGHGETSVSRILLDTQGKKINRDEPQILEVFGQRNFMTAIAYDPNVGNLIGEFAYTTAFPDTLKIGFKDSELQNPAVNEPIKAFVSCVKEHLISTGQIWGDDRTQYVFGCPSGWNPAIRNLYSGILQEAGLQNTRIVAESRAAFIFSRENRELSASNEELDKNVLIIDIGSSTTDFTSVVGLKESYLDFGENLLGASLIDKLIFKNILATHPRKQELELIFQTSPGYKAKCELTCRRAKEKFFSREGILNSDEKILDSETVDTNPPINFFVTLTKPMMAQILNTSISRKGLQGLSWPSLFKKTLSQVQQDLQNNPPNLIIITGGASRMGFIKELCSEIFPTIQILRGSEPQFAIARGLAWAGFIDRSIAAFKQEVKELVQTNRVEEIVEENLSSLIKKLGEHLSDVIPEEFVLPALQDWKIGSLRTFRDVESQVGKELTIWLNSPTGKESLSPIVDAWFMSLLPEIEKLTNTICDKYEIDRGTLRLTRSELPSEIKPGTIFNSKTVTTLGDEVAFVVGAIVSLIIAAVAGGGGTALIATGPIGWVIGLVLGIFASVLGHEFVTDWAMETNFPDFSRQLFPERRARDLITSRTEKRKFERQIIESIKNNAHAKAKLSKEVSTMIDQELSKSAEKIELVIK